MKSALSWLLGFLSIGPGLGLVLAAFVFPEVVSTKQLLDTRPIQDTARLMCFIVGIIMMIVDIILVYRLVPSTKRALWVSVLLFGNVFVLPAFWFHYLRPVQPGAQLEVRENPRTPVS